MKKILLVGFHKYDDNMYPHLKCFIDKMSKHCDLEYFHFRERGNFMRNILENPTRISPYLNATYGLVGSVLDAIRLKFNRKKYDKIIAIDHYAYSIVSLIFKRHEVIFWSHDIITPDMPMYSSFLVKRFMKRCSLELRKRGKVIIQNPARLALLLESLTIKDAPGQINHYYMPIFLGKSGIRSRVLSSESSPRVIQCGGIGSYRYSDDLLEHYQTNSGKYRLYFHGRIFDEIQVRLRSCVQQPFVSSRFIRPDHLCQIVDFCDIGFVGYRQANLNFRLIAKSSGQVSEFLRAGLPLIVLGENDLGHFVEEHNLGVSLKTIGDINTAIGKIVANYQNFSRNCFKCFDDMFDSDKYIPQILDWF